MRLIIILFIAFQFGWSHGGAEHTVPPLEAVQKVDIDSKPINHSTNEQVSHHLEKANEVTEFPTLHPLIVHFPIVLLLILPFLMLAYVIFDKIEILWITTAISFGGTSASILASTVLHPHTSGINQKMMSVLAEHDFWAYSTSIISSLTLLSLIILLIMNFNKIKYLTLLLSISAAITVSIAGHYGATLTHLLGVGPQGNYLELNNSHNHNH